MSILLLDWRPRLASLKVGRAMLPDSWDPRSSPNIGVSFLTLPQNERIVWQVWLHGPVTPAINNARRECVVSGDQYACRPGTFPLTVDGVRAAPVIIEGWYPSRGVVTCETEAAYVTHVRVLAEPCYSGVWNGPKMTLCGRPLGWDKRVPIRGVGTKSTITCRSCHDMLLDARL